MALLSGAVVAWRYQPGPATWPLLGAILGLGWSYSGPPLRLESRGLGEGTIALVTPGLVPVTGFYLQTGRIESTLVLALVPLVLLEVAMSLAINLPDARGDAAVGKRTLVVILGVDRAAFLGGCCP